MVISVALSVRWCVTPLSGVLLIVLSFFFNLLHSEINKPNPERWDSDNVKERMVFQVYCSELGAFQLEMGAGINLNTSSFQAQVTLCKCASYENM